MLFQQFAICRWLSVCLCIAFATGLSDIAAAEIVMRPTSCGLPKEDALAPQSARWTFLSMCVDGKGYGYGALQGQHPFLSDKPARRFGKVSNSEFYGFVADIDEGGRKITYVADGRKLFSFDGMGFLIEDDKIAGPQYGYIPRRGNKFVNDIHSLAYFEPSDLASSILMMFRRECTLAKVGRTDVNCSNGEQIWFFSDKPDGDLQLCRKPTDPDDCAAALSPVIEPILKAIERRAQQASPEIRARDIQLRSAVLAITQSGMMSRITDAQKEITEAEARLKLHQMTPGQLFALQDEVRSSGDVNRARSILRFMVSRYPDEKLSETAAKLLLAGV